MYTPLPGLLFTTNADGYYYQHWRLMRAGGRMNELAAAAAEGTGPMNWLIGAATVVVAVVGLWLAHSYRRQMVLRLSQTRLEAYSRLWEITGVAAPTRLDGWGEDGYLRIDERRDLWAAMTD